MSCSGGGPAWGTWPGRPGNFSHHTVRSQAYSAYRKLGVSSRSQAVSRSRDLMLIDGDGIARALICSNFPFHTDRGMRAFIGLAFSRWCEPDPRWQPGTVAGVPGG